MAPKKPKIKNLPDWDDNQENEDINTEEENERIKKDEEKKKNTEMR